MEAIQTFIEEQLRPWDVPGAAVVAVRGDEAVLCRGFGVRDTTTQEPVTANTLFAIGSTSKAFTASAVGAMVDDGLVEWDKPLREYMPEFRLHDPVATERVTVLDMLSHRSGLPRHEFTWVGQPDRSRADLVRRLRHLPLSKGIREVFQYCNLGYLTAGYLVEVMTGMTWEDYVMVRLLKPLGMDRTNLSVADSQRSDDYSKAHERRGGSLVEIPFRSIDQMGPAGSINSCVADMTQWLRVHLGKGRVGEVQVVSPDTIRQTHSPQMVVAGPEPFPEVTSFAYGLGWLVGTYRGRPMISHGGGIDGFLTECMMLPDDDVGVVVLTNSTSHSMGPVIAYRVLDELLHLDPIDWFGRLKERYDASTGGSKQARAARTVVEGARLPRPLDAYAGDYEHPGYGVVSTTVDGDRLVPHFGTMSLTMSHRHFDVFDLEWHELGEDVNVFPLTFLTNPDGDVGALEIPFEASVAPIRFERLPDACDPQLLALLEGTYAMGPIELVVAVKADGTLTLATPDSPTAELVAVRGLRFAVKEQPTTTIEFVLGGDGGVEKAIVQPVGIFEPKG